MLLQYKHRFLSAVHPQQHVAETAQWQERFGLAERRLQGTAQRPLQCALHTERRAQVEVQLETSATIACINVII